MDTDVQFGRSTPRVSVFRVICVATEGVLDRARLGLRLIADEGVVILDGRLDAPLARFGTSADGNYLLLYRPGPRAHVREVPFRDEDDLGGHTDAIAEIARRWASEVIGFPNAGARRAAAVTPPQARSRT